MFLDDPKEKLKMLLEDILRPYPELFCGCTGIQNRIYDFCISNRELKTFTKWSRPLSKEEVDLEKFHAEVHRLIEEEGC